MLESALSSLAVVVIGRNEGERLRVCLHSLHVSGLVKCVVYVDSGSTDGSVALAKSMNCLVHSLDMSKPFTAARARNEGAELARDHWSDVQFLQFVDGDCEVVQPWLPSALDFISHRPDVAVVCGRRRERNPQASIYNKLCDIEWNTPAGLARSCGGDALIRAEAFFAVGGYRADLIAGEEPELCVRLRTKGWKVWRLDAEMTLHDAAMYRFAQWWNRSKRAGYAFAQGSYLHGAAPEHHYVRETRRAVFWGGALPIVIAFSGVVWSPWCLVILFLYPIQVVRLATRSLRTHPDVAGWRAYFLVLSKFPECLGVLKFWRNKFLGRAGTLIEYK